MVDTERRRAERVAHAFVVRYKFVWAGEAVWSVSTLRNFSRVGARFLSERLFGEGDELVLQVLLPTAKEPVWVRARVIWIKPAQWGTFDLGVAFEPTETAARKAITDAADFFTRKKL